MQLTRRQRIPEAKAYVAGRLGVSAADLSDPVLMYDVRRGFGLGLLGNEETAGPDDALGLQAKVNVHRLLDVPIPSVERFEALTTGAGVSA